MSHKFVGKRSFHIITVWQFHESSVFCISVQPPPNSPSPTNYWLLTVVWGGEGEEHCVTSHYVAMSPHRALTISSRYSQGYLQRISELLLAQNSSFIWWTEPNTENIIFKRKSKQEMGCFGPWFWPRKLKKTATAASWSWMRENS